MIVSDLPPWAIRVFAFAFGSLWGSFFNVAIYRWPRDMSVVSPPSHCPHCNTPVPAWRNVPILGYLLLKGRAACCGHKLTPRYALVELSAGVLCVALAERYMLAASPGENLADVAITTALFFCFVGGLLVVTFVDLEHRLIPDEVSIGGAALGLATVGLREPGPDAFDAALGAGGGFLLVQLLLVWSWERLTGRRGMGDGDSKLMLLIGAFIGWRGMLFALVAGAMQGLVGSAVMLATRGKQPAPATPTDSGAKASDEAEPDADPEAAPAPEDVLALSDGARAVRSAGGRRMVFTDAKDIDLWEYVVEETESRVLRAKIPFGPFLSLAALEFLFFGEPLIELYLSLFE